MGHLVRLALQVVAAITLFGTTSSAIAEIHLIDRESDSTTWLRATKSLRIHGAWDLAALPDFGVASAPGPLGSNGGGPIPPGFLPSNVQLDTTRHFANQPIVLAFVGPSANGANNIFNAIIPNQPQDAFVISFAEPVLAIEFDAVSCSNCGGAAGVIDVHVRDNRGELYVFSNVPAPADGRLYGLVAKRGERIVSIVLSGPGPVPPGGNHYFPGIQGAAAYYGHGKPK